MDYLDFIIEDPGQIAAIAESARRVAVLGIKPETHRSQPAYYVPAYLAGVGIEIIPIPGSHATMLTLPHVEKLAGICRRLCAL